MLGGNEFCLRQGSACGKTLVLRKRTVLLCGAPMSASLLSTQAVKTS